MLLLLLLTMTRDPGEAGGGAGLVSPGPSEAATQKAGTNESRFIDSL